MKLIAQIPLNELRISLEALSLEYVGYTFVNSLGMLKIYKQVRK